MKRRFRVAIVMAVLVVGAAAVGLYANVMTPFSPTLGGGVPAYARIEMLDETTPLVHHTKDWAAITFYRDPACVPEDRGDGLPFNLLDFFDAPRAFGCTLTVEGFEIWRNGPWAGDLSPIQTESFGLGVVPIWFVAWDELRDFMQNSGYVLTMSDLEAMTSLRKGSAAYFKETLHPFGGAQQTKTQIVARGTLGDGTPFFFQVEETKGALKHVAIEFK